MPTRRSRTVTLIHSNEPRVKLVSLRSFHLQSQHGGRLRPARRRGASFARGAHGGGARGARAVRAEPLTKARTRSARVPRPQDRRRRAVFSAGHRLIHERRVPQGSCVSPSLVGRRGQRPETRAVPRGPSAGQGWFRVWLLWGMLTVLFPTLFASVREVQLQPRLPGGGRVRRQRLSAQGGGC